MILPAISIRQPWARAIVEGIKDVENRTWRCPEKYIGQTVFVHAGKRPVSRIEHVLGAIAAAKRRRPHYIQDMIEEGQPYDLLNGLCLHVGGIVGLVTITGCVKDSASPWAEPGAWHWTLADALCLQFHPCKGSLGFFRVEYPY